MTGHAFSERQPFPREWVLVAAVLGFPGTALATLVLWTSAPPGPRRATMIAGVGALFLLPLPALYAMCMQTEVRSDGVYYRVRPFHRSFRTISFEEVASVERASPRSSGPGLKWTREGWEYRMGEDGVRIERADGSPVYLGSERPDELARAIRRRL